MDIQEPTAEREREENCPEGFTTDQLWQLSGYKRPSGLLYFVGDSLGVEGTIFDCNLEKGLPTVTQTL